MNGFGERTEARGFIPFCNLNVVEETLKQYKRGNHSRERFIESVSPYLYYYPLFAFRVRDQDVWGDFYLLALERIDRIVCGYEENRGILFRTYLSRCLYHIWIKRRSQSKTLKEESLPQEEWLKDEERFEGVVEDQLFCAPEIQNLFKSIEDPFKYVVLKLYYNEFFTEEDFITLRKVCGKSYGECLYYYRRLLDDLSLKRRKKNLQGLRIGRLYTELLRQDERGEKNPSSRRRFETLYDKQVEFYHRAKIYPAYSCIADFFSCSAVDISNVVNNFKNKMKKSHYSHLYKNL